MKPEELKDIVSESVIDALIISLEAQLRSLRRLHDITSTKPARKTSSSQVDVVEDILKASPQGLHINEIIEQAQRVHGVQLERESIVSALSKKIIHHDRFVRVSKNTFALKDAED